MAPAAIIDTPPPERVAQSVHNHSRKAEEAARRDELLGQGLSGAALDATSDAIDEVNILKGVDPWEDNTTNNNATAAEEAYDAASKFDADKDKTQFRQYEEACDRVKNFYAEQHARQTVAHNESCRAWFFNPSRPREEMTIWQAMQKLDTLVDESDPDTQVGQIMHLLQSAEALRRDGKPRWMQLTGLLHDLGKLMFFADGACQGQWDVVGDTFPVGCAFDKRCIYPETFRANPDWGHAVYGTKEGRYAKGCGMDKLMISWGHDEFLYLVLKDAVDTGRCTLPPEALAIARYHSFYPWHKEGAYREFMKEGDERLLEAVKAFNPYDLYSKSDGMPDVEDLKPYYLELIDEYFPKKTVKW